ncbi:17-beta-hydroxysteroid dehydrogenase type 6-like [Sphaerodactylus townsendi]|uniref:17-beta-hydroxysteroid dehydrogenase type 6-like n=1 Tax=Sphaerodactylus townsendi TaxID=933632 RepID=UPI0020262053|nr:17-beta-hydroxysteroid dehydrogenase type 6-like [Sphaerodactylus townsendi]
MWLFLAALLGLYFLQRWYRERQTVENLAKKYVFITGCDSGFGNLLARQLDLKGMKVLAGCLTQKGAEELEKATSDRLKTTLLDVTSTESVAAAAEWVKECVGDKGLWGVVNNAGVGTPVGPNEWMTKEDFMKIISVNLLGVIDVTLKMLPLVKRARGRVVNVASVMGRLACFGGGYCPAKFGVEGFSDSLRRDMRSFGVRVSIVEPGAFETAILRTVEDGFKEAWNRAPSNIKEQYGQQYFEAYHRNLVELLQTGSKNLYMVTDSIEHALTSCLPRTRYAAGWDAKLFYIPASYLPTTVADYILTRKQPEPAQKI